MSKPHDADTDTETSGPLDEVLTGPVEVWELAAGWMANQSRTRDGGDLDLDLDLGLDLGNGPEDSVTGEHHPAPMAADSGEVAAGAAVGGDRQEAVEPDVMAADGGAAGAEVGVGGEGQEANVEPGVMAADGGAAAAAVAVDGDGQEPNSQPEAEPPRYNRALAFGCAAAAVVTSLVIGGILVAMRQSPHTADQDRPAHPSTQVSIAAAPTTTTGVATGGDAPIPYTATAVGCLPGSTTAQSVAGTDPTQAWVCVHGGSVGQHLVINLGRTMVITGVSITPGWVGADASGADQWLQHQVVKRLQWSFNDSPPTVIPQETRSVHGEAPQALPGHGVLASRIILLVLETGRAPADTPPSTATNPTPGPGGIFGDVLGPAPSIESTPTSAAVLPGLPADQSRTDPADNTFAVSSVKIFGHPPQ